MIPYVFFKIKYKSRNEIKFPMHLQSYGFLRIYGGVSKDKQNTKLRSSSGQYPDTEELHFQFGLFVILYTNESTLNHSFYYIP